MKIQNLTLDLSKINKINIQFWYYLKHLLNKNPDLLIPDSEMAKWVSRPNKLILSTPSKTRDLSLIGEGTYLQPNSPEVILALLQCQLPHLVSGLNYAFNGWINPTYEVSFISNQRSERNSLITFCEQYDLINDLSFPENTRYTYSTTGVNLKASVILACHSELDTVTWEKS